MRYDSAVQAIEQEYNRASSNYPPFASAHEGLAVLEEEFEELKREVFKSPKSRDYGLMKKEAVQIAAMAIRFITDVEPKANSVEAIRL
jgi:hypothetical protein